MKSFAIGWSFLILMLSLWKPATLYSQDFPSSLLAATLSGTITNAVSGNPIIGAKITVNDQSTWSLAGGVYFMNIDPVGSFPVTFLKAGFDTYTTSPVVFMEGEHVTINQSLWETPNPPGFVSAFLDTTFQIVYLNWELPNGDYELLYDNGGQDDFTIWAVEGNMNAVRFTPVDFPVTIVGGSIHIGTPANYPAGSNPLVPFQVIVYDATGSEGMPGNQIAGPFEVTPTDYGWNEFSFPSSVFLSGGDFYLAMVQGGNPPNAAGLAIDITSSQARSASRFVTGALPWMPANGNFLIRALCHGPGGPVDADNLSESLIRYKVLRLRQGEEQNPSVWVDLGTTPDLFASDQDWFNLPCSPYLWGIKAEYSANRWSPAGFSNILGKCWTVDLTVDVDLSCEEASKAGTDIYLKNLVYPDTIYTCTVDTSGVHTFSPVWKGSYELTVTKFGYQNYTGTLSLSQDTTVNIYLLQEKSPPTNLQVDDKTLEARWEVPTYMQTLFLEDWSSGSFQTQDWSIEGGNNWIISQVMGNPAPSAMFFWLPQVLIYEQTLTSKPIQGERSPLLACNYDIFLDNFGTTSVNQMAVEVWDGSAWNLLHEYTSAYGNIPWTTEQIDLTAYTDIEFRIRFRAHGEDSYYVNNWNIDNIEIISSETNTGLASCILGYNFYLENVLAGFTTDTNFLIPGSQVQYGQSYTACVLASYGSGYSTKSCVPFTSEFLYPPRGFNATPIENAVYLEWLKPQTPDSITPPGIEGYRIYRNDLLVTSIDDPDTLNYYDFELEPGIYDYEISAWYDLTAYGFPDQYDESMKAGPITVLVNYGRPLPFFESWDQASFQFNDWRFDPAQGNWMIDVNTGLPPPSARFSWSPVQSNYSYSLESPVLDATPYECSQIWLDFDLKLEDRNATGSEKVCIEIYYNNSWHRMTGYLNTGSFDWELRHIDISPVGEKAFRIRFRAEGLYSEDIIAWSVDNISVYPVCYPAHNLQGEAVGTDIYLTWSPPQCGGTGRQLNEGFEGAVFPPEWWDQIITNSVATWSHTSASSSLGVHSGNFSAGLLWDYNHQDEWLIARNINVTGNLTFWSYAYQGSTYDDHYYVKISPDGGSTWDILFDLSSLPVYPSVTGYNQWETPYEIDMSSYIGQTVDIAWQGVDNNGQGLWYSWAIDDCSIGTDGFSPITYDIYRRTGGSGGFNLISTVPVTDTIFLDENLPPQEYQYYVMALWSGCIQPESSDTITVDLITSRKQTFEEEEIRVFPIPAYNLFHVESLTPILNIELINQQGEIVLSNEIQSQNRIQIVTDQVVPGLYLMVVRTNSQVSYFKVLIFN
ncbi:MAG: choice-of-anchor J domain-containing protein [Bacteroidetes bacterium]|nr:choice-of-anchor J domain-containing protein [Bacteroidota bacterium]